MLNFSPLFYGMRDLRKRIERNSVGSSVDIVICDCVFQCVQTQRGPFSDSLCLSTSIHFLTPLRSIGLPGSPDHHHGMVPIYPLYSYASYWILTCPLVYILSACQCRDAPTCFFNKTAHSHAFWEGIWGLTQNSKCAKPQVKFSMILLNWPFYIWFGFFFFFLCCPP